VICCSHSSLQPRTAHPHRGSCAGAAAVCQAAAWHCCSVASSYLCLSWMMFVLSSQAAPSSCPARQHGLLQLLPGLPAAASIPHLAPETDWLSDRQQQQQQQQQQQHAQPWPGCSSSMAVGRRVRPGAWRAGRRPGKLPVLLLPVLLRMYCCCRGPGGL